MAAGGDIRVRDVIRWAAPILGPDRGFMTIAIVYGIAVSLLSLATPISVQMLINSIANTGLPTPLFTLAGVLFVLLLLWAGLNAFRTYLMELFRRRFAARMAADVAVRVVHAADPYFQDNRRADLLNRYFEMMTVHKAIPGLVIGGFSIILTAGVGLIVTSFYHPFFLFFNLLFVLLVWLIWRIWSRRAMQSSIALSSEKYALAHWLESIGASDGFYKSARHLDFALQRSEAQAARYVAAHRAHFRRTFPQTLSLYLLYAFASAALLALGGWLVIQEQLSIGQLIAAELILTGVFFGVAQLGVYLEYFYDLVGGLNKLDMLYSLRQEPPGRPGPAVQQLANADLVLDNVRFTHDFGDVRFDFAIAEGAHLVASGDPGMERVFAHFLKRHLKPDSGVATIGGVDIASLDILSLRRDIVVLDRPNIIETSIAEYLDLANGGNDPAAIMAALKIVGLYERVTMLPDAMQTLLSPNGWPLSMPKTVQLKMAAAILSKPRILVLSPIVDMVSLHRLDAAFRHFKSAGTTLVYFTNRPEDVKMDRFLWVGREQQLLLDHAHEFDVLRARVGKGPGLVRAY